MLRRWMDGQTATRAWLTAAAWSVIIFLTVPFARGIQRRLDVVFGSHVYLAAAAIMGVFFAVLVLAYVFRRDKRQIALRLGWLAVLMSVSVWVMRNQLQTPAEAIHFFQYGLLSLLFFQAWRHHVRHGLIYPLSLMSVVLVASFDEFLQWMMPGRFWDFRDIRLNLLAGLIVQAFISRVIHPSGISGAPADPRAVRITCGLAALTILLFGLAVSNTPARVDLYSSRIPFLRFLYNNESVMSEYGYRYRDPEIGIFYSRLSMAELEQEDRRRGGEAGEIIRHYDTVLDYAEFLRHITAAADPFVHEMRVHMHRRDHYLDIAPKFRDADPAEYARHLTIAYRENQLLERYFPVTLEAAGAHWPEGKSEALRPFVLTNNVYLSQVSDHLVTNATEFELRLILLLMLLLVAFCYLRYGRRPASHMGAAR